MFTLSETDSAQQAADLLAQHVAADLRTLLATQERATLAVSGGKSPIAFFHALNQAELDWSRVNLTLADERIVPTGHDDSNTRLVRGHLLQNRAAAAQWLPLIDDNAAAGSLNTPAALSYAAAHFVRPDILVLGMGNDGHTASLFPHAPQLAAALAPDCTDNLAHTSPQTAPHERISMTLSAIERVPHIYLAIGGSDKRRVFQAASQAASAEYPVSFVLHSPKVTAHVIVHP